MTHYRVSEACLGAVRRPLRFEDPGACGTDVLIAKGVRDGTLVRVGPNEYARPQDLSAQAGMGGFIYLPQQILDWMNRINPSIHQLGTDIRASNVKDEFKQAWSAFESSWTKFYDEHSGGGISGWWSRMPGAVADEVAAYEDQFTQWRDSYLAQPGNAGTLTTQPPKEHGTLDETFSNVTKLVIAFGVVYAVVQFGPLVIDQFKKSSKLTPMKSARRA